MFFPILLAFLIMYVLILAYSMYFRKYRSKVNSLDKALKWKNISLSLYFFQLALIAAFSIMLILVLFGLIGSHRAIYFLVIGIAILVEQFIENRKLHGYLKTSDPPTILAGALIEQHDICVKSRQFEKAYQFLKMACDTRPDSMASWGRLATFCELILKDHQKADEYLMRDKNLLESKTPTNEEIATYENYLGNVLFYRGERMAGLEHLKKSIELSPNSLRISGYEAKRREIVD
jgi:tetratricopeptide (TPR) repeat protein